MKKPIIVLTILGTLFATNIYLKYHNLSVPKPVTTQQNQLQLGDDYQKEQSRLEYLKKLNNPEYVQGTLRKTGKLTVLEGDYKYKSVVTDKGFMDLTLKEMTLDLYYEYGLGINLEYIKVKNILNKTIVIQIPKNRLQLMYIQMNSQNSKIVDGKKMILVSQFKPSDIELLIENSQQDVVNRIGADSKVFNEAMSNLKSELEGLILKMGYDKVLFEIV